MSLADSSVRRVALVRLRVGLGDLLCSMPATRALRRRRPDLEVTLVTWPEMSPLVQRMEGDVDELLPFSGFPGIPERLPRREQWGRFVAEAADRRFDLALQCYGDNVHANTVAGSLGSPHVGGFLPDAACADRDPELHLPYPTEVHETERHLMLLRHLGIPAAEEPMFFPIRRDEEDRHRQRLRRLGLDAGGYVVLHPGAESSSRRWPPDRFARVADSLAADGHDVVLTGTRSEAGLTRAVASATSARVLDLTGTTGLGDLAALLRDSAVLVGNDTGTAHLAAAVGARTVTVFLSGDPLRWAHRGSRHAVVSTDVGCNPCPHLDCPIEHPCAAAITPAEVVEAARDVLRRELRRSSAS